MACKFPYHEYCLDPPDMLLHDGKGTSVVRCGCTYYFWNIHSETISEVLQDTCPRPSFRFDEAEMPDLKTKVLEVPKIGPLGPR